MADDFLEERLTEADLAVPQHPLTGLALVPPELVLGLLRGREHSAIVRAMKPRSGSASLAETSWFT